MKLKIKFNQQRVHPTSNTVHVHQSTNRNVVSTLNQACSSESWADDKRLQVIRSGECSLDAHLTSAQAIS